MNKQPFTGHPGTLLAIDPKAFGLEFLCLDAGPAALDTTNPHVTVVRVDGPISYDSFLFDSYDSIRERVSAACATPAPTVCMRINSPGGDLNGAFDCARDLRRIARTAGKRLVVHVEAQCCSAAYALACAADQIAVSATGQLGSIGVIAQFMTAIEAAREAGLSFTLVSSGAYKADGNDQVPIDDSMRARLQA